MALHFSGLFGGGDHRIDHTAGAAKAVPVSDSSRLVVADQIKYVRSGQTLQGEIVAKDGKNVQIRLDGETVIHARLERDNHLSVGQSMTFEVRTFGTAEGQNGIALRPLYENLMPDENVRKALQAAGMIANGDSIAMVRAMMKEGMSIDINSLQGMYKELAAFSDARVEDLVSLHKLGLPVNEANLKQMAGYRNLEYQILNSIETLANEAADTLLGLVDTEPATAGRMLYELFDIFGGAVEGKLPTEEAVSQTGQRLESGNEIVGDLLQGSMTEEKTTLPKESILLQESHQGQEETTLTEQMNGQKGLPGNVSGEEEAFVQGKTVPKEMQGETLLDILPEDGKRVAFATILREAGLPETLAQTLESGAISTEDLAKLVQEILQKGSFSKRLLRQMMGSEGVRSLLQNRMEEHWLLQPEQGVNRDSVELLYRRLQEQTARLSETLEHAGVENSGLAKSAQTLQENVNFLNQLNQAYTYVQLPMKLSGQNTHGDLYVYTRKKNLAKQDGNVSALLHLDMAHLGSMDVYVAMNHDRVQTKFYLEREEFLDLLEQNLPLLQDHLKRRGYTAESEVLLHEKAAEIMEEIKKEGGTGSLLGQYSFDVRA